jgi:hypothetical protein
MKRLVNIYGRFGGMYILNLQSGCESQARNNNNQAANRVQNSTIKVDVVRSSETSVYFFRDTRCCIFIVSDLRTSEPAASFFQIGAQFCVDVVSLSVLASYYECS